MRFSSLKEVSAGDLNTTDRIHEPIIDGVHLEEFDISHTGLCFSSREITSFKS